MRRVPPCAAIAVWSCVVLSLAACTLPEPPPLSTALTPGPLPSQPPIPETGAPPDPEEARADMTDWLHKHGYQDYQVQALLEHAKVESGFRACAVGPGGYHYIFQWGGGRLRQLQEFAHTSGCPHLHTQLAFADQELRDDPKFSCFWGATTEPAAFHALRRGFGGGSC